MTLHDADQTDDGEIVINRLGDEHLLPRSCAGYRLSICMALAHKKLQVPGGVLALVLPFSCNLQGLSWEQVLGSC